MPVQQPNTVDAGPATGTTPETPTFRHLVALDLPSRPIYLDAFLPPTQRDGTTDNSADFANALNAAIATGARLILGTGPIVIANAATLPPLVGISLIGDGVDTYGAGVGTTYSGTVFVITDTVNPAFILGVRVTIEGCGFFYPGQTESSCSMNGGIPIVFPPLFASYSARSSLTYQPMGKLYIRNCRFINPYDLLVNVDSQGLGDIIFDGCRGWAVNNYFQLANVNEVFRCIGCLWSYESYGYGVQVGSKTLLTWHTLNASFLHVVPPTSGPATSAGLFSNGCYHFGMATAMQVDSGAIGSSQFDDCGFDAIERVLSVAVGGTLYTTRFINSLIYQYNSSPGYGSGATLTMTRPSDGATIPTPLFFVDATPNGIQLRIEGVQCDILNGSILNIISKEGGYLEVVNVTAVSMNAGGSPNNKAIMSVTSETLATANSVISIRNCRLSSLRGNDFTGAAISVSTSGTPPANNNAMVHLVGNTYRSPYTAFDFTGSGTGAQVGAFSNFSENSSIAIITGGITINGYNSGTNTNSFN